MHAQWRAAQHQILQNYAPADPVFTYGNLDSSRNFNSGVHTHNITESFQFPGVSSNAGLRFSQATRPER
jgi:hypothetical protein